MSTKTQDVSSQTLRISSKPAVGVEMTNALEIEMPDV